MLNPLISIIIPTYNEEQLIEECLKSLLAQNYQSLEIIIVDDGSIDNTVNLIKKYPVKLIQQKHLGPATARNLGVKDSYGEIICFLDADMTFEPEFIEKLTLPIRQGKSNGTYSRDEYIGNWSHIWSRCWNYNQGWSEGKMHQESSTGSDFRAILKSEFERVNGFDLGGYTDTWSLSNKLGYFPSIAPGAKFYHYNPESLYEVFIQAKWSSKRDYKYGILGRILPLVRVSLPVSLYFGFFKSLRYLEPRFIIFKVVYDFGAFIGIIEKQIFGKLVK